MLSVAVNWIEASAIASAAVAIATLGLAIATACLAKHARASAKAAVEQVTATKQLAESAQKDTDLRAEQHRTSQEAAIRIARTANAKLNVQVYPSVLRVHYESIGSAPVEILDAKLGDDDGEVKLAYPTEDKPGMIQCPLPKQPGWGPLVLEVGYRRRGRNERQTVKAQVESTPDNRFSIDEL